MDDPLHNLPLEIWHEIFLFAANPFRSSLFAPLTPWRLSHVCRTWRAAALSLAPLWGQISATIASYDPENKTTTEGTSLDYIESLLARSARGPLFVILIIPYHPYSFDTDPLIDKLVAHSERWESLILQDITPRILDALKGIRNRLPNLRSLMSNTPLAMTEDGSQCDFFSVAPRLEAVSVIFTYRWRPTTAQIELFLPWSQLKVCRRFHPRPDDILYPFISCPNLTKVELSDFTINVDPSLVPLLVLPFLTRLELEFPCTLGGHPTGRHQGFFERLSVPALQNLHIRHPNTGCITALTSMVARMKHSWPLESLAIFNAEYIEPGELSALLLLLPRLKILRITLPHEMELRNLILKAGKPSLVPEVMTMEFEAYGASGRPNTELIPLKACKDLIRDLVLSRFEASDREGKSFTLTFFDDEVSLKAQQLLEPLFSPHLWTTSPGEDPSDPVSRLVKKGRDTLLGVTYQSIRNLSEEGCKSLVTDVFEPFEALIIDDVRLLYVSSIHLMLHKFSLLQNLDTNTFSSRYGFRQRAYALLQEWAPLLREDFPNRRWHYRTNDLQYIPTTSHLSSSHDWPKFIYGDSWDQFNHRVDWKIEDELAIELEQLRSLYPW